jgi:hypothetical protein
MPIFGNTNKFAIEYDFIPSPYEEEKLLKQSWGIFRLWVEGKDLCEYKADGVLNKYEWNLIYIIEWLCDNLKYIVGYDPFPVPVKGENLLELLAESYKFDSEDIEEDLWYDAVSSWIFRHSWLCNRAGSIVSNVDFRRVDENIELTWDNDFWEEYKIYFSNVKGVYIVPKKDFKEIIFSFLTNALEQLEGALGKDAKIDDRTLAHLHEQLNLLK